MMVDASETEQSQIFGIGRLGESVCYESSERNGERQMRPRKGEQIPEIVPDEVKAIIRSDNRYLRTENGNLN